MTKDNQPLSILVIEDNPGDFLLIDDYLLEKFSAIKVVNAESFESAVKFLQSLSKVDVILLDLELPDLRGEKLVEALQEYTGDIQIIILTNYSDTNL